MPQSAMATGIVDYVVAADQMAGPLLNYARGAAQVPGRDGDAPEPGLHEPMQNIFALLRHRTGHDFSNYKPNTIRRRLERRMNLQQIERVGQYLLFLQEHSHEIDLLGKELLIGVTGFFRDPDGFGVLKRDGLLPAMRELHEKTQLRVWVPGCSSGEEAYSLAILFQECAAELGQYLNLQIFATDLDHESINVARTGFYPDGIAADVGPERLKRCFVREENGYRIRKDIRDGIVFAPQNVIKDPPFIVRSTT
jgi:two-component system CheB/CheR fusion protein